MIALIWGHFEKGRFWGHWVWDFEAKKTKNFMKAWNSKIRKFLETVQEGGRVRETEFQYRQTHGVDVRSVSTEIKDTEIHLLPNLYK